MSSSSQSPVTILTSGIGLGIYIPTLLIQRQLEHAGIVAEVEVLESYYTCKSLQRQVAHREACRDNFAFAQMAHRLARSVEGNLDGDRIRALLDGWIAERRADFIVWSGFWLPVLEEYRRLVPHLRINPDLCRIDAVVSASFKVHRELERGGVEIWLWNGANKTLVHQIPVMRDLPVPFARRRNRLVVHGGGWGLGTYADTLQPLARAGYALDVVIRDPAERQRFGPNDCCYMLDPTWEPWHRDAAGRHIFPPMGLVNEHGRVTYNGDEEFHSFHRVIRQAKAVVSKPGGCTLIDSLAAATPVVFLEPYGYAERANADIWEHLGFGVPYADWEAEGFRHVPLERAHAALAASQRNCEGYPRSYASRYMAEKALR